jgi:hypothetical protein
MYGPIVIAAFQVFHIASKMLSIQLNAIFVTVLFAIPFADTFQPKSMIQTSYTISFSLPAIPITHLG